MEGEADWAETKTILQEVEKLFQNDDDIKDILEIEKMKMEIGKLSYTHESLLFTSKIGCSIFINHFRFANLYPFS